MSRLLLPILRLMLTSGSSIACWPARTLANDGPATGLIWSATPRPGVTNLITTSSTPLAIATT